MIHFGKFISKHAKLILLICLVLLIPATYGMIKTRINYDVLSYLPDNLETVNGQNILLDEFGMGAFSMVVVEDMEPKEVQKLEQNLEKIQHVKDVIWYDDALDINVPVQMLPSEIKDGLFQGNATMLIALFDDSTSSDTTMDTIQEMRKVVSRQCYVSGMSAVVTDIKGLFNQEMPIYVAIAAILSLIVLMLTMNSLLVPVLFLLSIGIAILYNLGSNIFLGEISYITQALTAILQLGVTMDYSIFLLNSYEENKLRFPDDNQRAMSHAISNTFQSVAGSSVTTIAGFIALCFMSFTLGKDIGIVMAKGVILGVICCVTLLPSLILVFDKAIDKTTHRSFVPSMDKVSAFITRHYFVFFLIFVVLLFPAIYGNNHVNVYYRIDEALPADLQGAIANKKLDEDFQMNSVHMVLLKNGLSAKDKSQMLDKMENIKGVKWSLGLNSLVGANFPESMLPKEATSKLKGEHYELVFVCSDYKTATAESNQQVSKINDLIKTYSPESMIIGEAPLTKDLVDVTDTDFKNVSIASIAAIFAIILIVFRSISIPFLLVAVIEFAIFINMAFPYYTGVTIPFVSSVVIGTIQLGATVDYAILMTTKYQKERVNGKSKKEAVAIAHRSSIKSILISGCSFFAATFGVGMYSKIDMISSICNLLSRGAVVSTIVVICILPAMFMLFDGLIIHTSLGFRPKKTEGIAQVVSK
ncbi:efflux RND transporter permease subunit [[Clostridium] polysaccharolyticum]|uniref:Membrane transport protein MMPL domain-containing protein n=1 Tax=[Clostridium] polysaccharolyticum TaxID=29364 RepID=A0A1I0DJK3_9FIRM|nr:MMPL family transporter [[Clostridium] polysaccharolyticum]SET32610.1 hypothetical protein SAMN04487772_11520 [[Clostridium] polysaccharolyticum]